MEGDQPTLEDLQPLYQALAHGCMAGMHREAGEKVYYARILRGDKFYSSTRLGALGTDLEAIACFFKSQWTLLLPGFSKTWQPWLLNQAGLRLRALGRLSEAIEPMRAGLKINVKQREWKNAAAIANNICELQLTIGELDGAIKTQLKV